MGDDTRQLADLVWKAYNAGWMNAAKNPALAHNLFGGWDRWRRKHGIGPTSWEERNSRAAECRAQQRSWQTANALRRLAANGFGRFVR